MTEFVRQLIGDTCILVIDGTVHKKEDFSVESWEKMQSIISLIEHLENEIEVNNEMNEPLIDEYSVQEQIDEYFDDLMQLFYPKKYEQQEQFSEEQKEVYNLNELRLEERKELADLFLENFDDEFKKDEEGYIYLKGFTTPLPKPLIENLLDAHNSPEEAVYTERSLINFWKWLMVNPDKHVRTDLFKWINTGQWSITDEGMIISYRNVNTKEEGVNKKLEEFITENYLKIKRWKKSPKNYYVIFSNYEYFIFNKDKTDKGENLGTLEDLYKEIHKDPNQIVYTDNFSGKMEIKIGQPVSISRQECDNNPNSSCSRGLHQMSKAYGLRLGQTTLTCLVNPYNVVAVPRGDSEKFRTCEYLPIGVSEKDEDGDLLEWEGGTYQMDYPGYTEEILADLFNNNQVEILKQAGIISDEVTENIDFTSLFESRDVKLKD